MNSHLQRMKQSIYFKICPGSLKSFEMAQVSWGGGREVVCLFLFKRLLLKESMPEIFGHAAHQKISLKHCIFAN